MLGATGPFITGLIDVIGLKRTILGCMAILMAGTGLSIFMTAPWELFLTWGLMVGIGSGGGAVGIGRGGGEPLVRATHRPWPWAC